MADPPGLSHVSRGEGPCCHFCSPKMEGFGWLYNATRPPAWQEVATRLMVNCLCPRQGRRNWVHLGIIQDPTLYIWAVSLLFQHYSEAEGWLCCLGSFSITMSFALILCVAGTISSCVCGSIYSALSTVPDQRTQSVLGLFSYFILLSAGKSVNALWYFMAL